MLDFGHRVHIRNSAGSRTFYGPQGKDSARRIIHDALITQKEPVIRQYTIGINQQKRLNHDVLYTILWPIHEKIINISFSITPESTLNHLLSLIEVPSLMILLPLLGSEGRRVLVAGIQGSLWVIIGWLKASS